MAIQSPCQKMMNLTMRKMKSLISTSQMLFMPTMVKMMKMMKMKGTKM